MENTHTSAEETNKDSKDTKTQTKPTLKNMSWADIVDEEDEKKD